MDTAIIVAIIAAISSSGVSSLLVYLLQRRDKKNEKKDAHADARDKLLLGLAHECIVNRGEQYIARGWVDRTEYDDLNKYLYQPYKAMGGDGTAEKVMREVEELPFRAAQDGGGNGGQKWQTQKS